MIDKVLLTKYNDIPCMFAFRGERLVFGQFKQMYEVGDLFIGKVLKIQKNLNAAFIEYRNGCLGYLPLSGNQDYKPEMALPVMLKKAAVKTKEPVLSDELSLTGLFCVVTSKKGNVVFSKALSSENKNAIYSVLGREEFPFTVIVRTNAAILLDNDNSMDLEEALEPLLKEISNLVIEMTEIVNRCDTRTLFLNITQKEHFLCSSVGKIKLNSDTEIITDVPDFYEQLSNRFGVIATNKHLRFYSDSFPLLSLYSTKREIERALSKRVWLKSGGSLIVEQTEAMVVIDVNTGKNEKKLSKNDLIMQTNHEAVSEIALQIQIRNLTGMILIDFVKPAKITQLNELLLPMKKALCDDWVKTDVIDITSLGLMEITREKKEAPFQTQIKKVGLDGFFKD